MTKLVCVVGLAYVGLHTELIFANHGLNIHGFDLNPKNIKEKLNIKLYNPSRLIVRSKIIFNIKNCLEKAEDFILLAFGKKQVKNDK